jgi:PAS domain S-box-containing protein
VRPSRRITLAPTRAYAVALTTVVLALCLRWPLQPILDHQLPFLLFFPAVMLTAWYGGLRPGLVATALSGAFAAAFLLPALFTGAGHARLTDAFGLAVFLLVGVAFSVLSGRFHAATEDVHSAYESEQALKERLAVTLRSIGDAVVATDAAGRVTFLNPVAETLTGWESGAAHGRPLAEVFVIVDEGTHRPVADPVQTVIREGRVVGLANHTLLISRAGVETSIADSAAPIRDLQGELIGVVLVFRDAGPERAAERALQESAARFRQMADAMPQMVWTARPDGFIDYYNARWCEYARCDPGETGDATRRAIIHPDDLGPWLERWARSVRAGEPYEIEYRFKDREGGYRWFLGRALPVRDDSGEIVKWFGTCTDIDAQKRAEAALKDADRRKDQFLAMLSHELRNPLAPIRNAIELLKRLGPPDPRLQRARDIIDRQTEQLTRLTDDLLEVSRITSGKIRLEERPIDAAAVVTLAVETSAPLIEARRHALEVRLPAEPLRVRADARRLAQVLGNILNNAAKYTQEGGHISVTLERDGKDAVFRVKDDGPGIPAEMLDKVFDLFTQVDRSLARSQGGLGIGLTLARTLIEMHGGTVRAFSEGPGKGSELVVRLPVLAGPAEPPTPAAPPDPGDARAVRILVVDDNVDAADSLRGVLELSGHDVRVAYEGPTALDLAEAFRPSLVLLDLGLPGMDGHEVARRLRERHGPSLVLVALTGYGREEDRRRTREAGFDRHLVKPLEPDTLSEVIAGTSALDNP